MAEWVQPSGKSKQLTLLFAEAVMLNEVDMLDHDGFFPEP
jgi:hypothetical protein